jgi:hypothetical protein
VDGRRWKVDGGRWKVDGGRRIGNGERHSIFTNFRKFVKKGAFKDFTIHCSQLNPMSG